MTQDDKKKINLDELKAPFVDLLTAVQTVQNSIESNRHPWTPTIQRVISTINRYATVGDVLTQFNAEYTSLAWGSIRFLLIFAAAEHKVSETVANGLASVTQIVFRAEGYAKLFATPAGSTTDRVFWSLQDNLTTLYAEVLNFLVRAAIHVKKGTLREYNLFACVRQYFAFPIGRLGTFIERSESKGFRPGFFSGVLGRFETQDHSRARG